MTLNEFEVRYDASCWTLSVRDLLRRSLMKSLKIDHLHYTPYGVFSTF